MKHKSLQQACLAVVAVCLVSVPANAAEERTPTKMAWFMARQTVSS